MAKIFSFLFWLYIACFFTSGAVAQDASNTCRLEDSEPKPIFIFAEPADSINILKTREIKFSSLNYSYMHSSMIENVLKYQVKSEGAYLSDDKVYFYNFSGKRTGLGEAGTIMGKLIYYECKPLKVFNYVKKNVESLNPLPVKHNPIQERIIQLIEESKKVDYEAIFIQDSKIHLIKFT